SEWFSLASRSAAEYYDHLRKHEDWGFDAMYWLGDDSPMKVSYAIGGKEQENPAHFVDLLAAFACLDFCASPPATKACYYAGPQEEKDPQSEKVILDENILSWDDIPMSNGDRD